jgi:Zn-dependent protease/predicted transcriptional regulator
VFGRRFALFKLFGFEVRAELSWLVVVVLFAWSLSTNVFPMLSPGLTRSAYWWLGIAGTVGLFGSVVFHELCHSLVARRYGLPIKGITLFIFGGVAEMDEEPPSARSELVMALAGPASSALLGLLAFGLRAAGEAVGLPQALVALLSYLASVNGSLAAFNIIPAFPLDGGRVLRSVLWSWRRDLRWATRIASWIGSALGAVLIALGVLGVLLGSPVGGIWMVVIGLFVRNASRMSYQRMFVRQALEGELVSRFMKADPVTVSSSSSLRQLVEEYIYRYHYKMLPVVDGSVLVGCVTTRAVSGVPQEEWDRRTVGELATGCSPDNTISPTEDAMTALSKMGQTGNTRLMVVDNGRLVGVITLKDMLAFLDLKVELEHQEG